MLDGQGRFAMCAAIPALLVARMESARRQETARCWSQVAVSAIGDGQASNVKNATEFNAQIGDRVMSKESAVAMRRTWETAVRDAQQPIATFGVHVLLSTMT
jgi:hypothetical protein